MKLPDDKRGLVIRAAIWNALVLGALIGVMTLVQHAAFGGKIPSGAAVYVIIGFYLAALLTTSFVYRGWMKRRLAARPKEGGEPRRHKTAEPAERTGRKK